MSATPAPDTVSRRLSFDSAGGSPGAHPPGAGPGLAAPKPRLQADVKLTDSRSPFFQRMALTIRYFALRFFAWLFNRPWSAGSLPPRSPRPPALSLIPAGFFARVADLKAYSGLMKTAFYAPHVFSQQQREEFFRTIGHGDEAKGKAAFDSDPFSAVLYLKKVRWEAAGWGDIQRGANTLKEWARSWFSEQPPSFYFDPEHANGCLQPFYRQIGLSERELAALVDEIQALRNGITEAAMRQGFNTDTLGPACQADPFAVLLIYDETQARAQCPALLS